MLCVKCQKRPAVVFVQRLENGKTVQEGCTCDMLFKIDEIIEYISKYFTLKTGDILYTGTPVGVAPVNIDDHLEGYIESRKVLEFNVK